MLQELIDEAENLSKFPLFLIIQLHIGFRSGIDEVE